jgi:hypothetical protein
MISIAIAAAALLQWTGPRTVEYVGPGHYCGGGYSVLLSPGDRALVLPQGHGPQATRLVIGGREVNVETGARPQPGRVVRKANGSVVTEQAAGNGVAYLVTDETPFGLRVSSTAFHGFARDRWFFAKANFASNADESVDCLSAKSF